MHSLISNNRVKFAIVNNVNVGKSISPQHAPNYRIINLFEETKYFIIKMTDKDDENVFRSSYDDKENKWVLKSINSSLYAYSFIVMADDNKAMTLSKDGGILVQTTTGLIVVYPMTMINKFEEAVGGNQLKARLDASRNTRDNIVMLSDLLNQDLLLTTVIGQNDMYNITKEPVFSMTSKVIGMIKLNIVSNKPGLHNFSFMVKDQVIQQNLSNKKFFIIVDKKRMYLDIKRVENINDLNTL